MVVVLTIRSSKVFICLSSESAFTAYLNSSRGDVWLFAQKNFKFCGFSKVAVRVITSGCVFRLSVSGKARFLPLVQLYVGLEIFLE